MTVKGMVLYRNIVEWKAFIPDLRSRLERERLQNGVKEEIRPNVIYQQIPLVSGTGFLLVQATDILHPRSTVTWPSYRIWSHPIQEREAIGISDEHLKTIIRSRLYGI